jgi:hypothetical protein
MGSMQTREALGEARTARDRLFTELENLRAREQVDGSSDGLAERIGNLNRAIEKQELRYCGSTVTTS